MLLHVIQSIPLEHEYSEAAALSLMSLDVKQTEALGNKYIFDHIFQDYCCSSSINIFQQKSTWFIAKKSKEKKVFGVIFGRMVWKIKTLGGDLCGCSLLEQLCLSSWPFEWRLFQKTLERLKENGVEIFGFDVSKYILNSKYLSDKMILKNNVNIIVYRNTQLLLLYWKLLL